MMLLIINAWCAAVILMTIFWAFYLWLKNPGVIDVAWGLAITLSAVIYLFGGGYDYSGTQTLFTVLLCLWCARLSGYLLITRIIPGHLEKRYLALSEGWRINKIWGFFLNYQLQALLAMVVALPFIFIGQLQSLDLWSSLAMLLIIVGLVGETMADKQLQDFRRTKPGNVCNVGLWNYSRHPNYFFEVMIWFGFSIAALTVPWAWLGLISPLLLLSIMLFITGPLTEKGSLESKGEEYANYQRNTPMFFPWSKREP